MIENTRWVSVILLFFCGCTLAMHIGKLPPALPLLSTDFQLSLVQAGVLVATFSLLIGLTGLIFGILVSRFGYWRFACVGVAVPGLASLVGATADAAWLLMLCRALEGLGWIIAVVAIPNLMANLAKTTDKPVVLGLWGAFVPAGTGLMLLSAPIFQDIGGWQLSWRVNGYFSLLASLTILLIAWRNRHSCSELRLLKFINPLKELRSKAVWGLFFCFCFYSFQFVALTSFLPTLLVEQSALQLATASRWTALVVLANVIGNIMAGRALRGGVAAHTLLVIASLGMGVMACVVLSINHAPIRITSAILFAVMGGFIPGSLFATAPRIASQPAAIGVLLGFMLQAAGLGQWSGPIVLTQLVEATGHWWHGGMLLLAVALLGAIAASLMLADRDSSKYAPNN